MIIASSLLSQGVEVRKAGQPSYPIHLVTSLRMPIKGMTELKLVEMAMYSASMEDKAVIVCILDAEVMGAPAKQTIQPDLDLDVMGSTWASERCQFPAKSASIQQSKCQCDLGRIMSPLSCVAERQQPICLTASA